MKKGGQFWVGFSDLMTSMFFVMLVLYAVSFVMFREKEKELNKKKEEYKIKAEKYKIIEMVEENLAPLKENTDLFTYDETYKRYNLSFDIAYKLGRVAINNEDIINKEDIPKLIQVGKSLENLIKDLLAKKNSDKKMKNISYLVVVSGSSSATKTEELKNYQISYRRAFYLYKFWQKNGVDLDQSRYHDIVDFHIAGNGIGGVGRVVGTGDESEEEYNEIEAKNQRFIINIIPKVGKLD